MYYAQDSLTCVTARRMLAHPACKGAAERWSLRQQRAFATMNLRLGKPAKRHSVRIV